MERLFAERIVGVPKSFIREILKVSLSPDMISFAGGLPNKELFPQQPIEEATTKVFREYGKNCFQYGNSEGFDKLRQWIASRYAAQKSISVKPENILITNGSQQGFDLLGKILLNDGDGVVVEQPGYLGAIQSLSVYRPRFYPFHVSEEGVDMESFAAAVSNPRSKLIYTVPNFQNPSGITYSRSDREEICSRIEGEEVLLVEDDPYGELRFHGEQQPSLYSYLPAQTILLGSFSKTVIPGFRIGWIVAPDEIMEKLLIAKQASDLHTCHFTQYILYTYLCDNDLDDHVQTIVDAYGGQCRAMIRGLEDRFEGRIGFTRPQGGMFLWGQLPRGGNSMDLFEYAAREKVVFVPGQPFYIDGSPKSSFRLSFSCVDEHAIETGLSRLQRAVDNYFAEKM